MCREMGAGAGAVKKGKKYGAGSDPVDDQPSFDHDAWRTPKIRGQAQPASERRDIASSWSPRQGGKPVTMLKAEKPKTASSESRPVTRPLGSPQAATSPGLMDTLTSEAGIKSQTLGTSKGAMEYIPALGDEPRTPKGGLHSESRRRDFGSLLLYSKTWSSVGRSFWPSDRVPVLTWVPYSKPGS